MSVVCRPSGMPGWASGVGATNVTEPPANLKATGFGVNAILVGSYLNWLNAMQHQWISYLDPEAKAIVSDDFSGRDIDMSKWASIGNVTGVDDSSASGFGAAEFYTASGFLSTTSSLLSRAFPIGPTGDFSFSMRLRSPSGHTGTFQAGLISGLSSIYFLRPSGSSGWQFLAGAAVVATSPTGINPVYQTLAFKRDKNQLSASVDGVQIYSASNGASLYAETLFFSMNGASLPARVRVDSVNFKADINR